VPTVQKNVEQEFKIEFDYTMMSEIMNIIKQNNCRIIQQDLQLFCVVKIAAPKRISEEIIYKIKDLKNAEIIKV